MRPDVRTIALPGLLCLLLAGCKASPEQPSTQTEAPAASEVLAPPSTPPPFVDLTLETSWGCALHRAGTVHCWGDDPAAALGLREPTSAWQLGSEVEGLTKVVDITSLHRRICVAFEGGEVTCLIHDEHPFPERVTVDVRDVVQLESHYDTCARERGGAVHCWRSPAEPRRVLDGGAIDISVGPGHGCALDADGGIWCWSDDGPAAQLAAVPGVVDVEVGDDYVCVRHVDGRVLCSTFEAEALALAPVAGLERATSLGLTMDHACAVLDDGSIRCFGANGWAQLGDGSSEARSRPVAVAGLLGRASKVAVSASLSCASNEHGLACWGTRNTDIFDDAPVERARPLTEVTGVAIEGSVTCATTRRDDGLWCWGAILANDLDEDPSGIFAAAHPTKVGLPEIATLLEMRSGCLLDDVGELRCGSFDPTRERATVGPFELRRRRGNVSDFAESMAVCVISKGKLVCDDRHGGEPVIGVPAFKQPTAIYLDGLDFVVVHDGGALSSFSIRRGADIRMRASTPIQIPKLSGVRSVFKTRYHGTCVLHGQGEIGCWWSSKSAQAGDLDALDWLPPAVEAVAYLDQVCVRTADGRVACRPDAHAELEWLEVEDAVDLESGAEHMCVLEANGELWCVGANRRGELGVLPSTVMAAPLRIELADPREQLGLADVR